MAVSTSPQKNAIRKPKVKARERGLYAKPKINNRKPHTSVTIGEEEKGETNLELLKHQC